MGEKLCKAPSTQSVDEKSVGVGDELVIVMDSMGMSHAAVYVARLGA